MFILGLLKEQRQEEKDRCRLEVKPTSLQSDLNYFLNLSDLFYCGSIAFCLTHISLAISWVDKLKICPKCCQPYPFLILHHFLSSFLRSLRKPWAVPVTRRPCRSLRDEGAGGQRCPCSPVIHIYCPLPSAGSCPVYSTLTNIQQQAWQSDPEWSSS